MSTCQTCRWWKLLRARPVGECRMAEPGEPDNPTLFEVEARGDQDPEPRLLTGPEFGCARHEPARTEYR